MNVSNRSNANSKWANPCPSYLSVQFSATSEPDMQWRAHEQTQNGGQVPPSTDAFDIHARDSNLLQLETIK